MATNPLSTHAIPEAVGPFLGARNLKPLHDAVEEVMKVRAAYVDATRVVRALREQTRSVEKEDRDAFAAALRQDPSVDRESVPQAASDHARAIVEAAARASALAQALADAERDLRRAMRAQGPELLIVIDTAATAARLAVVSSLDATLATLAHLDQVRGVRSWAMGRKAAAVTLFIDERRLGAGPQPVARVLAEARRLLAESAPNAATDQAEERDADVA